MTYHNGDIVSARPPSRIKRRPKAQAAIESERPHIVYAPKPKRLPDGWWQWFKPDGTRRDG